MSPRRESRWMTHFGSWIEQVGTRNIVDHLSGDPATAITRDAIYKWLQGHQPNPDRAIALVELSEGALSLDDIYAHRRELLQRSQSGPSQ